MKVTIINPRWYTTSSLFETIADIVFQEGGDGWCWIKCVNPLEMCEMFVTQLNTKDPNRYGFTYKEWEGGYVVNSPYSREECWVFSDKPCDNVAFYESIVEIEE